MGETHPIMFPMQYWWGTWPGQPVLDVSEEGKTHTPMNVTAVVNVFFVNPPTYTAQHQHLISDPNGIVGKTHVVRDHDQREGEADRLDVVRKLSIVFSGNRG